MILTRLGCIQHVRVSCNGTGNVHLNTMDLGKLGIDRGCMDGPTENSKLLIVFMG